MKIISQALLVLLLTLTSLQPIQAKYKVRPLDQAVFHNNQGVRYLNDGNTKKAKHEFKIATELSPEYSEGWSNLGLVYLYLKDYDKSREAFLKAVDSDKDYAVPYNHLATLYYTLGQHKEAAKWVKKAIKKEKHFGDAYYNQGLIYGELARQDSKYYEDAEKAFRFASEANPKHYLSHYELGKLYMRQGRLEEAMIRFKVSLEIQPSSPQVWRALGDLYRKQGRLEKAQFALNKAIAAGGGNLDNHLSLAEFYIRERNFVLAKRELDLAKKNKPGDPAVAFQEAYLKLAEAEATRAQEGMSQAQGLYQQAINAFKGLDQSQANADVPYNIAYLYSRLSDLNNAKIYYAKALEQNPEHALALFSFSVIELAQGEEKQGLKDLCRFLTISRPEHEASRQAAHSLLKKYNYKKKCAYSF